MADTLRVSVQRWPIAGAFTIARGTKTEAVVVVVEITRGGVTGVGECVPYARYGETVEAVVATIEALRGSVERGLRRGALQCLLPAGAARNAIDSALWSLEARLAGRPAWALAGLPPPQPVTTAFTISLADPETMARATRRAAARPLLKIKLGGDGDAERIAAVREAAPLATLIVDANESWRPATLAAQLQACARAGVALIEQPLPAGEDAPLDGLQSPVPLCADESFHGLDSLETMVGRYSHVNIKLDKTGGLTAAIEVARAARECGLGLMIGCMLGTSLAMAPAYLLTPMAAFVDLDGPLLLARDREPGFAYDGSTMLPAGPGLWG